MFTHEELVSHTRRLRNFSMKLTRNAPDSDDLLQSTLERALEKGHLFRDGTNLFSWSSRIMFNLFITERRRSTKGELACDPDDYMDLLVATPDQQSRLEVKAVLEEVKRLPAAQREVVELICIDGNSYEEAAELVGVPVGTIRSRLARARAQLGSIFTDTETSSIN